MPIAKAREPEFASPLMGAWRLFLFLGLIATLVPAHLVYSAWKPQDRYRFPQLFHRLLLRVLGFKLRVYGEPATKGAVLFVANHTSYLDVTVLGALLPASFVAKSEVAGWPLFGMLAKLQNTAFVERRPSQTGRHSAELRERLEQGGKLILFPEGTSTEGVSVLPFKSALFSIVEPGADAEAVPVVVQPVSVVATKLFGLALTRDWRPYYAWYGDMTLAGHLWHVFKLGRFTVDVVFHPPVSPAAFPDRKDLAAYCHDQVAHGIQLCLGGRTADMAGAIAKSDAAKLIDAGT